MFGLFLYALGVVFAIQANIGYAPWAVFHVGLSHKTGLSIGTVTILTGVVIVALVIVLSEKIGLGTLLNMIFIGAFTDLIFVINIIPKQENFVTGTILLIIGLFVVSVGSYFYIRSGLSAGPRDSLMVAINRKTRLPIGLCRSILELTVTFAGWLLGGMVGIGTVISVITIGFFIQFTFALFKFDPKAVKHETLQETYNLLRNR
jgi:uncharacterized membrane protein YczE